MALVSLGQEVETYLHHFINYWQDDWTKWITPAEFALNNRKHSSTGYSPFELDMGRQPLAPSSRPIVSNNPRSAELVKDIQALWAECKKGHHKVAEMM